MALETMEEPNIFLSQQSPVVTLGYSVSSAAVKTYACPHCSQSFTRHHNLKSHLLIHSQEKKYTCQRCSSKFRRIHDLKRHLKLHTGERPYLCGKCGRRFARGDALVRHTKSSVTCSVAFVSLEASRVDDEPTPAGGLLDSDLDDNREPSFSPIEDLRRHSTPTNVSAELSPQRHSIQGIINRASLPSILNAPDQDNMQKVEPFSLPSISQNVQNDQFQQTPRYTARQYTPSSSQHPHILNSYVKEDGNVPEDSHEGHKHTGMHTHVQQSSANPLSHYQALSQRNASFFGEPSGEANALSSAPNLNSSPISSKMESAKWSKAEVDTGPPSKVTSDPWRVIRVLENRVRALEARLNSSEGRVSFLEGQIQSSR